MPAERERLIRFYDYDELVQACLALGSLALTAKNEYKRAESAEDALREADTALRIRATECLMQSQRAQRKDALLREALAELNVLASYLPDGPWPNIGLKVTAKAHAALAERIQKELDHAQT